MTHYLSFKELKNYKYSYSDISENDIKHCIAIAEKFDPAELEDSVKKIFKKFINSNDLSFIDEIAQEDINDLNPLSKAVVLRSIDKAIFNQIENISLHHAALALTASLKNSFKKLSSLENGQVETIIKNPMIYKNIIGSQMANYLKNSNVDHDSLFEYVKDNARKLSYDIKYLSDKLQVEKLYNCKEAGLIIKIFSFFHSH